MPWNATSRGEVFVIDDDARTREALSNGLQEKGYDVISFADGAALLSYARTRAPVCVFIEVDAVDRSGFEVLKKLRSENCTAPIFVTSANGAIPLAVDAIRSGAFDFIVCNIANPDMVGHSGILAAAIKAVEAVDVALGKLTAAILEVGGEMLITADHGNLEQMVDANHQPHTQHTVGPVPLVYVGRRATLKPGALRDLAPTVLGLMNLPLPPEMTGQNLVQLSH